MKVSVITFTALLVLPATEAATFFANYQPEVNTANTTALNDLWPGFITAHDSGTTASLGTGANYIGAWRPNQFSAFSYSSMATEFVAPNDFIATYITFPASFSNSFANFDTLTGISIRDSNGTELGYTRVRVNTLRSFGAVVDYTLPFGTNQTGSSGGFNFTPVSIQAGETYTVSFQGVPAGSAGGYNLVNSTTDGAATNTTANYAPNSTQFQPAFALNDGTNSVIPEPSSAFLVVLGLGLARRKR